MTDDNHFAHCGHWDSQLSDGLATHCGGHYGTRAQLKMAALLVQVQHQQQQSAMMHAVLLMKIPACLLKKDQLLTQLLWNTLRQLLQQLMTHLRAWLPYHTLPKGRIRRDTAQVLVVKVNKMHICLLSISRGCRYSAIHKCTLPTRCCVCCVE